MRIALFGQAPFGKDVLDALLEANQEIAVVYTPPDSEERPDPLAKRARELSLTLEQPRRYRNAEVIAQHAGYQPDLNVLAFVTAIIPDAMLEQARLGSIEYHPSLLPRHRGRSAMNWAIINGEAKTGLTIFWVDAGIDTGPILLQKEVEIGADDTLGSLYFGKLYPLGVGALVEAVNLVAAGAAPRIPQDETQATSEPPCEDPQVQIDWSKPARQVYNLIRGANPQPGAHTTFRGNRLRIFDVSPIGDAVSSVPGLVQSVGATGLQVAAGGGAIEIRRVMPEGSPKIAAADFVAQFDIRPGERLGS